jgi:uncharacterized protein YjiK
MKRCLLLISAILALILSACKTGPGNFDKISGYNFNSPDASVILPDVLHEISGLTYIDSTIFACIQDEKGILFFYDMAKNKISSQLKFFSKGDYEGIARVKDTIYVLRSDGTLYEISDYKSDSVIVTPYPTNVPSKDNEGLCYDSENNRLLIACKENTGKGDLSKDKRYVFGFDLISKSLVEEPLFSFDIQTLKEYAKNHNINLPLKEKKKGSLPEPVIRFRASAISIHPVTDKIYVLSAEDYLLFIFKRSGNIDQMVKLNAGLFNQPEGITFLENGDMLISNEGQGKGPASLRRLNYHPVQNHP